MIRDAEGNEYANVDELWAEVLRRKELRLNNPSYRPPYVNPAKLAEIAKPAISRTHVHSFSCMTDAVHPGQGFPTREQLIAESMRRRSKFDAHTRERFVDPNEKEIPI